MSDLHLKIVLLLILPWGYFNNSLPAQSPPNNSDIDKNSIVKDLISENSERSRQAVEKIRQSKDPAWLEELAPLLEKQEGRARQIVTMLVLGVFPDKAFDFFKSAANGESVSAREAAMYGFARIPAAAVVDELLEGLNDPEKEVRGAALRGIQLVVRPETSLLFPAVLTSDASPLPKTHPGMDYLQQKLRKPMNPTTRKMMKSTWHEIATRETHLAVQDLYLKNISNEAHRETLYRIFDSARNWTSKPPASENLGYDFSMVNLVAGSSKDIRIDASPVEISLIRHLDYHLDRGIHLRMAVDLWMQSPDLFSTSIKSENGMTHVDLDLSTSPDLNAGVGCLNIAYWQGRVNSCQRATLIFDSESGRFVSESGYDSNGSKVWEAHVKSWIEGDPDLPKIIEVSMPRGQVGARQYHLAFKAEFGKLNQQWHLVQATMNEWAPDPAGTAIPELRALAEVSIDPAQGSSADSNSGQGSKGSSPRE